MGRSKIFIVDDEEDICKMLAEALAPDYDCSFSTDAATALEKIAVNNPDLILLDYNMPNILGIDICRSLRDDEKTRRTPVIFISGAANIDERIECLEVGANDFLSKPFHFKELTLRIKSALGRNKSAEVSEISAGNLTMNLLARKAFINSIEIFLTPKQFEILRLLVINKNQVVTREMFLNLVWGDSDVSARNVDSQLTYLKSKTEGMNGKIQAIPSLGYKLIVP